jgi:hypothetical protein
MRTPIPKRSSEIIARNETSTCLLEIAVAYKVQDALNQSHMAGELMSEQEALMEKLERFEALPEVWLQNELLEQTRDYLTRGRRFGRLRLDRLNEEWAKAFRQFVTQRTGPHLRDMDDAGAELRFRGEEFPTYLVTSEVEQLRTAVQRVGPVSPSAEFVRKIDEFIRHMNKPKH